MPENFEIEGGGMTEIVYSWRNRHWTPERIEILIRMWREGAPIASIAEQMHATCSEGAVRDKAQKLGLPPREGDYVTNWSAEKVALLKQLWCDQGASAAEIAAIMGPWCTRSAVIGKAHRLKYPHRGGTDSESRRIISRRNAIRQQQAKRVQKPSGSPLTGKRTPALVIPHPEPGTASAVKFEALEAHHCRFVHGEGRDRTFCGCPTIPGKSWCAHHFRVVYREDSHIMVRRRQHAERQPTFYELLKQDA